MCLSHRRAFLSVSPLPKKENRNKEKNWSHTLQHWPGSRRLPPTCHPPAGSAVTAVIDSDCVSLSRGGRWRGRLGWLPRLPSRDGVGRGRLFRVPASEPSPAWVGAGAQQRVPDPVPPPLSCVTAGNGQPPSLHLLSCPTGQADRPPDQQDLPPAPPPSFLFLTQARPGR